jgi:hypothetical protein
VSCNIKDLIKFLKQKKMRNKLMHIRNCDVPTDVKQMAKGVMLARPTFAAVLIKKFYPCVDIYPVQDPIDHRFLSLNWYFRCWKPLDFKVWKTSFNQQMAADKELVSSLDTQKLINTYEHLFKLHNCSAKRNSCSCSAAKSRIPAIMTIYQ